VSIKRGNYERAKSGRLAEDWPRVSDAVFQALGVSRQTLASLEHSLLGRLVLPGMWGYEHDRHGDDLCQYSAHPKLVAFCTVPNDVRFCLEWAQRYGWDVTCRSGGHSTAGFSTNDGLVIDLRELNHVCVDPVARRARVGAGTRFTRLNSVLDTYRLHVPGGTCGDVAVGGYMQGGGYGFTSRQYGMNCDNVVEALVMLADGRLVVASEAKNPDLFWALRGGTGGNFGVLLEVTYQLHDLSEVWGFALGWPLDEAPAVLHTLQAEFTKSGARPELGYHVALIVYEGRPSLLLLGMYDGRRADGLRLLDALLALGKPAWYLDRVGRYATVIEALEDLLPGIPPPPGRVFEAKDSQYVTVPMSVADWAAVAEYFGTSPHAYNMVIVEPYGGQINAVAADACAFVHRDVYLDFYVDSFWKDVPDFTHAHEARGWLRGFMDLLRPFGDGHKYQNYPVRGLPDFRWAYWGDAFPTLLFVKQKYDPHNFFRFEQSISPYPTDGDYRRSTVPSRFADPRIVEEAFSASFLDSRGDGSG
jgi:FAD/FMN-containing dehydrogenase